MDKRKTVTVMVTKKFEVDKNRPRPKWWDNYIGTTFRCYDECEGWWKLSTHGLNKSELSVNWFTIYYALYYLIS